MTSTQADPGTATVTGVRQRTRRAILDAAMSAWATDFTMSLGDIADRAEVSRSTLHRYFPDRQTLVDAVHADAVSQLTALGERAMAGCDHSGAAIEALIRVGVELGDAVLFLFSDPSRFADSSHWEDDDEQELPRLMAEAQSEGVLAPDMDAAWLIDVFYSLIFVAAEAVGRGRMPRHRAAEIAIRTFLHGASPSARP